MGREDRVSAGIRDRSAYLQKSHASTTSSIGEFPHPALFFDRVVPHKNKEIEMLSFLRQHRKYYSFSRLIFWLPKVNVIHIRSALL
jgi:hypothetical protein